MSRIFTAFVGHCEPIPICGVWQPVGTTSLCRPPTDLEAVVTELQEKFGADELVDSGLVRFELEGLVPNELLHGEGVWLQPHVDAESQDVVGISTSTGLITADGPSHLRSLEMALHNELRCEAQPRLFITNDVASLAVITSLGLVARTSASIVADDPHELESLFSLFGWRTANDHDMQFALNGDDLLKLPDIRGMEPFAAAPDGVSESISVSESGSSGIDHVDCEVIFVAWLPATLTGELPLGQSGSVEYLRQVQDVFGRDLSNVSIWRPSESTLKRLRFASVRGTPNALRLLLDESLAEDRQSLGGFLPSPIAQPGFLGALAEVGNLEGLDPEACQRAKGALNDALSRDLLDPLLVATQPTDAVTKGQYAMAAMLQRTLLALYCDIQRSIGSGDAEAPVSKKISSMVAICNCFQRIAKDLGDTRW